MTTMQHPEAKNIAETVREIMEDRADVTSLDVLEAGAPLSTPHLVSVPQGRKVEDITDKVRAALSYMRPLRRKGTDTLHDLQSLIDWTIRFKGEGTVIFADMGTNGGKPTLTAIADWHHPGPAETDPSSAESTARHADHRAVYAFPNSKEWDAWMAASGKKMTNVEMAYFLEDRILDVLDPPATLQAASGEASEADRRLIEIAAKIGTRYGTASQLMAMAKEFVVHETSNFAVTRDNTSGEGRLQITSEHRDAAGKTLQVPGLFLVAIPVFEGGPAYRLPVRFQYRKTPDGVAFFLTLHDPQRALDNAFGEAVTTAEIETSVPVFKGKPGA